MTGEPDDTDNQEEVLRAAPDAEWLCTNARGSFAMGTIDRRPRRKYHSLLTVREPGVGEPLNLLAELEEWFLVGDERYALHSYDWGNAHIEPNGVQYLTEFEAQPRWTYRFGDLTLVRELWLEDDADAVWIRYSIEGITKPIELKLRPLLRYRPIHKLTFANPFLNGQVDIDDANFVKATMQPYKDVPPLVASLHGASGVFEPDGHWYEGVHYDWEGERGYDDAEDFFTPGEFSLTLAKDGSWSARLGTTPPPRPEPQVLTSSPTGRSFLQELDDAAESYLVNLEDERAGVIAGYPWFGEWSRDTLIALPGLCLARDKIDTALSILESLAARRENGLIPNLPRSGGLPADSNSIDASLLFIRAVALTSKRTRSRRVAALQGVCLDLIERILEGGDHRVGVDHQGFLFVEWGPWALTWMDAVIDGHPVTPRGGYAVELNALWLSGLATASRWAKRKRPALQERLDETSKKLADHFEEKFWLQDLGFLTDTHDGERPDRRLRPNQLWALVLPGIPLRKAHKRRALQAVREKLLTPVGLRTLPPDDQAYQPTYRGRQLERDLAYHQGTVWPWLLGLYADAVGAIEGTEARNEEMLPILTSLCTHLRTEGCIGQIGEVFDGDSPHLPGGAPAQAWSVGEVLRVAKMAVP